MRVLITGAGGFAGRHLIRDLLIMAIDVKISLLTWHFRFPWMVLSDNIPVIFLDTECVNRIVVSTNLTPVFTWAQFLLPHQKK